MAQPRINEFVKDGKFDTMQSATQLKICSWNINGLSQFKLSDDVLGKFLTWFDIIFLCETWTDEDSKF